LDRARRLHSVEQGEAVTTEGFSKKGGVKRPAEGCFVDPLTHGLVGAATAGTLFSSRPAACAGFVAALLPDLDVLLSRADDPLFQLEFHRQFSHSFLFIPVGALLATLILYLPMRGRLSRLQLYLACLCGFAGAGLLDACTSYGTQLLWPFSEARLAWNLTPVVEPLTTLGMTAFLVAFLVRQQRRWAALALGWLFLLLTHGGYRQFQALDTARGLWDSRGHSVERYVVKPTLGNQLLWRVTYIHGEEVYTDGVRTRLLGPAEVFEGNAAELVVLERDFAALQGTPLYSSLHRFAHLSEGFIIRGPERSNLIGDGRYAMLPTSLKPLWGIEFDPDHPDQTVRFETFRETGPEVRRKFMEMLF